MKNKNIIAFGAAMRGRYNSDGRTEQKLEINGEEYSNSITTVNKDSYVLLIDDTYGFESIPRIYTDISPALRSERFRLKVINDFTINEQ